jgi:hypothetical protein
MIKGKLVVRINNVAGADMTLCGFALFAPVTGLGCYDWGLRSPRSPCPMSVITSGLCRPGDHCRTGSFRYGDRTISGGFAAVAAINLQLRRCIWVCDDLLHGNHRRRLMMLSLS